MRSSGGRDNQYLSAGRWRRSSSNEVMRKMRASRNSIFNLQLNLQSELYHLQPHRAGTRRFSSSVQCCTTMRLGGAAVASAPGALIIRKRWRSGCPPRGPTTTRARIGVGESAARRLHRPPLKFRTAGFLRRLHSHARFRRQQPPDVAGQALRAIQEPSSGNCISIARTELVGHRAMEMPHGVRLANEST